MIYARGGHRKYGRFTVGRDPACACVLRKYARFTPAQRRPSRTPGNEGRIDDDAGCVNTKCIQVRASRRTAGSARGHLDQRWYALRRGEVVKRLWALPRHMALLHSSVTGVKVGPEEQHRRDPTYHEREVLHFIRGERPFEQVAFAITEPLLEDLIPGQGVVRTLRLEHSTNRHFRSGRCRRWSSPQARGGPRN